MIEDKLLIWRFKSGDRAALARIYQKYKTDLLRIASGLLNETTAAEDVVHDVFVSFARSARQFELTGSLRGYLATCATNRVRDKIRARARHAKALGSADTVVHAPDNPEQSAMQDEQLKRLRQAMNEVPYEQREAVLLHIKGGMSFRHIARLQGVSAGTIHGRYRYGLNKLRSLLNSEVEK